jgi:hypothetical protein
MNNRRNEKNNAENGTQISMELEPAKEIETDATHEEEVDAYFLTAPKSKNSVFEVNLAEFPIVMLSKTVGLKTKHEYSDTIVGRNGQNVKRKWTIEAEAKDDKGNYIGFGGPKSLQVIYEIFQIWNEQGFKSEKIYIGTYFQFLKRLGWGTSVRDYQRLKETLNCIHGLHIIGENCFYLKNTDEYANMKMYLFPSMGSLTKDEKGDHPDARFYITASTELFQTVKNNNTFYFAIDRDYFKTLTPMEQKLSLIISKYFSVYKKPKYMWTRNIFDLANQIPILSKDARSIRQQLKTVCEGLIEKKFKYLSKYQIKNNVITFYNNEQTILEFEDKKRAKAEEKTIKKSPDLVSSMFDIMKQEISGDEKDFPFFVSVAKHVPEDMIFSFISIARHEAEDKVKLFTHLVMTEAEKYMKPHVKMKDASPNAQPPSGKSEEIKSENNSVDNNYELFDKKEEIFNSLSAEKKKQLITFIKNKYPLLSESPDDSSIIIASVVNECITDDLKAIPELT